MADSTVYTKADIKEQLRAMSAPKDSVVLMHSSLRAIGSVQGGASALLDALIEYFTEDGGLFCIPTHTWHNIGKEITLDMASSDNCLGALSTAALLDGRGIRSESPIHSMVVFGDRARAEEFIKDEPYITTTTAPESCYGKLYSMGGYVLLVGVAQNRNTYLHSVGEILALPNRMAENPRHMTVRRASGEVVEREILTYHTDFVKDVSLRFVKYDTAFRYHRCITDGFIGDAPTQLCDARKMKETVELIFKNNGGKDPLDGEMPIPQKAYCKQNQSKICSSQEG